MIMPLTTPLPAIINVLQIAIVILALVRLIGLFSHPVIVPESTAAPSLWRTFNTATRLKFATGVLLLGTLIVALQVLDFGKGLQAFALILIVLFCGIGGGVCLIGAIWQHRYYLLQSSETEERGRQIEFDTIALAALLGSVLTHYLSMAMDPSRLPGTSMLSAHQGTILLATCLAVTSGVPIEPPSTKRRAELELYPQGILIGLFSVPWGYMKDALRDGLSPLFGYAGGEIQIVSMTSITGVQDYLIALILSCFCLVLLLPYLHRWLKPLRSYPMASSCVLAVLPASVLAVIESQHEEWAAPLSSFDVLLSTIVGTLAGLLLWYLCQAILGWLQTYWTGRTIVKYPFHFLSVACLVVLGWIGIFHVDGIDRYLMLVAECAALWGWSIRRLS